MRGKLDVCAADCKKGKQARFIYMGVVPLGVPRKGYSAHTAVFIPGCSSPPPRGVRGGGLPALNKEPIVSGHCAHMGRRSETEP